MGPKWAFRARLSFGVIDSLFMRAANDSIRHHDRFGPVIPDELSDLTSNGRIGPNVTLFDKPTFQVGRLGALYV